ncbi:MAG: hypothetical protein Athens101410_198 [Parcubacteria group bacterium Athens1014_10]|nr:MAG: hypothetical protein Athens101410_198 [Parcubacteria group bacterium Athens1014_10]TSD05562.1 MAG: hypothetical protein Athens071412_263 [Parcubacteria group bacterium Athens0714_12]
MDIFDKKRLLEKIKEKLKLILPAFVFDIILMLFRKIKLGLRRITPEFIFRIIGKIKRRIICEFITFRYKNYSEDKTTELYRKNYHAVYGHLIDNPEEVELKKWQAIAIQRAIPELKKIFSGWLFRRRIDSSVKKYRN